MPLNMFTQYVINVREKYFQRPAPMLFTWKQFLMICLEPDFKAAMATMVECHVIILYSETLL